MGKTKVFYLIIYNFDLVKSLRISRLFHSSAISKNDEANVSSNGPDTAQVTEDDEPIVSSVLIINE